MPDYSKGVIYTIRCRYNTSLIYVGSTIQPLAVRFGAHKKCCLNPNDKNYNKPLYHKIRETCWSDWYIELHEEYPCENVQQLRKREGEVIREIGTLNKYVAGRTEKEYREDNRENINQRGKMYREENKQNIAEYYKKYYEQNKKELLEKKKEYDEQNKQRKNEYNKEYREQNKQKIREKTSEKVQCECGSFSTKIHISRHRKSKKHLKWEATQTAATN